MTEKEYPRQETFFKEQVHTFIPEEMIELREKRAASLPEQFRDSVYFDMDQFGYAYDSATYYGMFIFWKDYETDEQYEKRVALMKQVEQREREELARLRTKYDNT